MRTFDQFLFKKIDNAPLLVFRVCYGILVCCEAFGAIATGWVRRTLVAPKFTFSFIGFDWLQPLPGNGMYFYFVLMGIFGLLITIGYKYRFSAFAFAFLWAGVYLMQKSAYNNHYYLLMLLAFIMAFLPANRNFSVDARLNPTIKTDIMPNWVRWFIIAQLFIVYTYASIAKLYADWFDFSILEILMRGKKDYWLIGEFLQQKWVHQFMAAFGILFDLLVVPALLWKPSRKLFFGLAVFFHLFNSVVFQIGIFPYLSLAFCVFFFDPQTIRKTFFKTKAIPITTHIALPKNHLWVRNALLAYLLIQLILPIRHHFIPGDVLWTEEGHRLSWRMMLRSRSGHIRFKVVDQKTQEETTINLEDYLTKKQRRKIGSYPDFIWQFAQHLKKEYQAKGQTIAVYAIGKCRVNANNYQTLIDPKVDLTTVSWNHFTHNEWILPWEGKKSASKN